MLRSPNNLLNCKHGSCATSSILIFILNFKKLEMPGYLWNL